MASWKKKGDVWVLTSGSKFVTIHKEGARYITAGRGGSMAFRDTLSQAKSEGVWMLMTMEQKRAAALRRAGQIEKRIAAGGHKDFSAPAKRATRTGKVTKRPAKRSNAKKMAEKRKKSAKRFTEETRVPKPKKSTARPTQAQMKRNIQRLIDQLESS